MSRSTTAGFDVHFYTRHDKPPYLRFEPFSFFCTRCADPDSTPSTPSREQEEPRICWGRGCYTPPPDNSEFCRSGCKRGFEKEMGVPPDDDDDSDDDSDDGKDSANVWASSQNDDSHDDNDDDNDGDFDVDKYNVPPERGDPWDNCDDDSHYDSHDDNVWGCLPNIQGRFPSVGRGSTG